MICPKCNAEIYDSLTECPVCGWNLTYDSIDEEETEGKTAAAADSELLEEGGTSVINKNFFTKKRTIGAAAVIVFLLLAAFMLSKLSGIGYRQVLSDYYKAIKTNDYALMQSVYPLQTTTIDGMNKQDFTKNTVDTVSLNLRAKYGSDYKIRYRIKQVTDIKTPEDVANVTETKQIKLKVTYSGNGKKDSSETNIVLVKINKKWYIHKVG